MQTSERRQTPLRRGTDKFDLRRGTFRRDGCPRPPHRVEVTTFAIPIRFRGCHVRSEIKVKLSSSAQKCTCPNPSWAENRSDPNELRASGDVDLHLLRKQVVLGNSQELLTRNTWGVPKDCSGAGSANFDQPSLSRTIGIAS